MKRSLCIIQSKKKLHGDSPLRKVRFSWVEPLMKLKKQLQWLYFYIILHFLHNIHMADWSKQYDKSIELNWEEAWCDSDLESWLKNQRNVFTFQHYERAVWNMTIKSPIVTLNVKLIGLTLWEELLGSLGPLIWKVTAGYSCMPLPILPAALQPLILLHGKPHKQYGKGVVLQLGWKTWSCGFHAKCSY